MRVSSTSLQLNKIRQEMEQLEKQKREYGRTYERVHSSAAPIAVPPRSVKSLTIVRPPCWCRRRCCCVEQSSQEARTMQATRAFMPRKPLS